MKKIVIWSAVVLFSLIILVGGAVAIAINFVFTPEKLTPMVLRVANENLDAKLNLSSVELTFFSTFPDFTLAIDNGALTSKQIDSVMVTDTIASFERLEITVNPVALILDKVVVVHKLALNKPHIYAAISPSGAANWNIYKSDTTSTDTLSKADKSLHINISDIRISDGIIVFDDRVSGLYTKTDSVSMALDGDFSTKASKAKLELAFRDGLLWHNNELVFKHINISTNASLSIDSITKRLIVHQSGFNLNDIEFHADGSITPDSVDLNLSLVAPSLATVLDILPLKRNAAKVSSTGSVEVTATVHGAYKNGTIPLVNATVNISDATAHYSGFQYGIDKLDAKIFAHLDMSRASDSYINIDKFRLKGASTTLDFQGHITGLLTNPKLRYKTTSVLNLTELAATLPLRDGTQMGGTLSIAGDGEVSASQIKKGEYATIKASTKIDMHDVMFAVKGMVDSKFAGMNVSLSNSKEGLMELSGTVRDIAFKSKRLTASLSGIKVTAIGVRNTKDSSSYLNGELSYKGFKGSIRNDSVKVSSSKSDAKFKLSRTASLLFSTDSLYLQAVDNKFFLTDAHLDVVVDKKNLNGSVEFDGMYLKTPHFPLKVSMPRTSVKVDNDNITLNQASLRVGSSDVMLTGTVKDLIASSHGEKPLTMNVAVQSSMLNLTEIIHTLNTVSGHITDSVPSEDIKLFKVPKNINFELNTNLKKVEFGKLQLTDTRGKVTIKNGIARLNNLSVNTMGARMATTIVYDCQSDTTATVGLMLGSSSIDVSSVIELLPSIDSLMPMLNSFEGKVDFMLAADTKFHKGFSINPLDIRATASFSGEDLVLLDGQTFTEISKLLMFKNKSRNVVDSVSVQMAVNNGSVEIFPFIIQMDRYRAAVGGEHFLDNHFKYHVSVLKSPIPFKFGINISGTLDNMKVGVGKTQYKFMNQPTAVKHINPKFVELGKEIRNTIRSL